MLGSALSALSGRIDSKFLTAFWLPAFVAVFCGFGILAVLVGPSRMEAWVYGLDSVEQTLAVLIIVLTITMIAFVLRALSRPISEVFSGAALPRSVAAWSTQAQVRAKARVAQALDARSADQAATDPQLSVEQRLNRVYPLDDAETQPTLFGNILATAAEYPQLVYTMNGLLWWPRLSPLVPGSFQDMLGRAQAPMMALLNLSVVFSAWALGGAATLVLVGQHWTAAFVVLVAGLLLARLCYRAAISQATEVGRLLRVAFDLYRHEILRQMDLTIPEDIDEERALWRKLAAEMLNMSPGDLRLSGSPDPSARNGNEVSGAASAPKSPQD